MNGLDLLLIAGVVVLALALFCVLRGEREDDLARSWQEETEQWAAEIEGVPLDWLDALDSIKRLPERLA